MVRVRSISTWCSACEGDGNADIEKVKGRRLLLSHRVPRKTAWPRRARDKSDGHAQSMKCLSGSAAVKSMRTFGDANCGPAALLGDNERVRHSSILPGVRLQGTDGADRMLKAC